MLLVTVVPHSHPVSASGRVIEAMVALARCSARQRIIVAGAKAVELVPELNRRGFSRVASTANCGRASRQYDVALADWRRRTVRALQPTLDWLVDFLMPGGHLVIWVDPQKASGHQDLCAELEQRGFMIEDTAVQSHGTAISARRRDSKRLTKAA